MMRYKTTHILIIMIQRKIYTSKKIWILMSRSIFFVQSSLAIMVCDIILFIRIKFIFFYYCSILYSFMCQESQVWHQETDDDICIHYLPRRLRCLHRFLLSHELHHQRVLHWQVPVRWIRVRRVQVRWVWVVLLYFLYNKI